MNAREETRLQIARCEALDRRIREQRRALRRECSVQRSALRRVGARVEMASHHSR